MPSGGAAGQGRGRRVEPPITRNSPPRWPAAVGRVAERRGTPRHHLAVLGTLAQATRRDRIGKGRGACDVIGFEASVVASARRATHNQDRLRSR